MPTSTQPVGARTALSSPSLSTLAAATYCVSSSKTSVGPPMNIAVEVTATVSATPTGNMQVVVYAQMSLDGTNYGSGPTSGVNVTDEQDLRFLGTVKVKSTGQHTEFFSLLDTFGFIPPYFRIVIKNDTGVTLTGGAIFTSDISVVSA